MYLKEFIEKVKKVYTDYPKIIQLAENGDYILGRYLDDASYDKISVNDVLEATSLEELKQKATEIKAHKDLYSMWWDETDKSRKLY